MFIGLRLPITDFQKFMTRWWFSIGSFEGNSGLTFCSWGGKSEYYVAIFSFFWKVLEISRRKKLNFFFPHLDPDFSLVAFLKPVFQLFRWVLKFCDHLMLSPSWDASQWHNIRKLRKVQLLLMFNQGAQKFQTFYHYKVNYFNYFFSYSGCDNL